MRLAALAPMLLLSGIAALVLEVAWFRRMAQISGATAIALAAVLAAVIGGMAAGALLFGRRADHVRHPIRLYAVLEAGVAVFALLTPWLLEVATPLFAAVHRLFRGSETLELTSSFLLSVLLLAIPAVLMGGTLPAAAAGLRTDAARRGRDVGWLYAVNTLGGVLGTLLAGFLLLSAFGLAGTMRFAALFSGAAAILGFVLGGRRYGGSLRVTPFGDRLQPEPVSERGDPEAASVPSADPRRAVALYAASGFLGLAAEVAFTRSLVLVFGSTTYAFSVVLAVFLLGIGLGGIVGTRLVRGGRALPRLEVVVPVTAALFSLGALLVYLFPRLYLEGYLALDRDFSSGLLLRFGLAALALLPGTIGLGIAFPLGAHVATEAGLGRGTARLYAANTLASIAGSTLAVFLLVPALGPQYAVVFVALAVGAFAFVVSRRPVVLLLLAVAAIGLIPPSDVARERLLSGVYYSPSYWIENDRVNEDWWREGVDVPFAKHGREATVAITRWYGRSSLLVDGKAVASDQLATDVQHLEILGHLPMAVHPDPASVLVVGLGMGTTYRAVQLHAPLGLTAVEIESAVATGAALLGVRPARLVLTDARTHLRATEERYDVITSDPIHPWVRGGGDLYTREYYELCRDRLQPGESVFCQWVPLYQMGLDDVRNVVRTFTEIFRTAAYYTGADLVLVGTVGGDPPRPRVLRGPAARAVAALGAPDLGVLFVAGHEELVRRLEDAEVLVDDALALELSTPRQLESPEMGEILSWVRDLWGTPPEPFGALLDAQEAKARGDGAALSDAVDRALASDPTNGFVKRFVGETWLGAVGKTARAGNLAGAERFLAGAKRLLGEDPRLVGVEADLASVAGDTERAVALFRRLLRAYPDSAYLKRRLVLLGADPG